MLSNNKTNITLRRNPKCQNQANYIDVIYDFVWGLVKNKKLKIKQITSLSVLINNTTKVFYVNLIKKHYNKQKLEA